MTRYGVNHVLENPFAQTNSGFTLTEMSIVLVVIGLIIMTVFPALNALRVSNQTNLTNSNLQTLLRATAAYAQANGCLPCPTPASTTGAGFGRVRGDTSSAACNSCASGMAEGIPPFVSLGIPAASAQDGWGRWITMRVDTALTGTPAFTPAVPIPPTSAICATGLSSANRISVKTPGGATQQAAVIFVSYGKDGYGAYNASALSGSLNGLTYPFPSSHPACAANTGFERCNASGTVNFVNASPVISTTDPYDDIMVFMARNALVSYFGNSTICTTTW